jgi:small-conductance mechanosensitive channel
MNVTQGKLTAAVVRRHKRLWREAYFRLIPLALFALLGAWLAFTSSSVNISHLSHKIVAFIGVLIFTSSAIGFLHIITSTMRKVVTHYLGPARAANAQFISVVAGYIIIVLFVLTLLHIPVGKLLLGGAVTGIILGVAAQQSLANFFASVILLITQPYSVGDRVYIKGGLGDYRGTVLDIGLIHTTVELEDGQKALLPNAAVLSGSAIMPLPPGDEPEHTSAG